MTEKTLKNGGLWFSGQSVVRTMTELNILVNHLNKRGGGREIVSIFFVFTFSNETSNLPLIKTAYRFDCERLRFTTGIKLKYII